MAPHLDDDCPELYALARLPEAGMAPVEEHLLVCEGCRVRLTEWDEYLAAMRAAMSAAEWDAHVRAMRAAIREVPPTSASCTLSIRTR